MPDPSSKLTILVVEDNPADLFILEEYLWDTRLHIDKIIKSKSYAETVELLDTHTPGIIFLDLSLTDSSGLDLFSYITQKIPSVPIIVLTGLADMEVALETMSHGAQDYLVKGEFDEILLSKSIQYSIERKKNLENIRVSSEQYSRLFYNNPMPIYIWDLTTQKILEVNEMAQKGYGYSKEAFLQCTLWDLHPQNVHDRLRKFLRSIAFDGVLSQSGILWEHVTQSGEIIFVDVSTHSIEYKGENVMMTIANNVSERIILEKQLEAERVQKQREIAETIIDTQEKDRHFISKELHDNVNQQLSLAMMYIASAERKQGDNTLLLKQSAGFVLNAIQEIRHLTKNLVTPLIKDFGLIKAIESIIDDISNVQEISIDFIADSFWEDDIIYEFKLCIYRIIQEQVNNVMKHAKASQLQIQLARDEKNIILSVADDGVGFDSDHQKNGIGLYNIISRVEVYQGSLSMETSPGNGCKFDILFPVSKSMLIQ